MTTIPPEARTLFDSLCDGADDLDLDGLRLRVHQHLDEMRRAAERDELLREAGRDLARQLLERPDPVPVSPPAAGASLC